MRKEIKIISTGSGADYFGRTLHKYFNEQTIGMFKNYGRLEVSLKDEPFIKNIEILGKEADLFILNYSTLAPEIIKKVREMQPKIKILCITSTKSKTEKDLLKYGVDAVFDCESIPVKQGGSQCQGSTIGIFAWIFEHFPEEPIENTWSKR